MPYKFKKIIAVFILLCFSCNTLGLAQTLPYLQAGAYQAPALLRYVSVNSANPFNYFNFLLDSGDLPPSQDNLGKETKKLINYFFLGLTLSSSSLWVNLRPDEPDKITSGELAKTDMGRILLEQDLRLKKDMAKYLHPANETGKAFWKSLYQAIGKDKVNKTEITTYSRVWIAPDKAVIMETEDGALVAEAKLKVLLESEYLKLQTKGKRPKAEGQKQNLENTNLKISEKLMREVIIPQITADVNTSSAYAPLRQIYHSLILAEWYKQKHKNACSAYSFCINKGYVDGLESDLPWSKQNIWKEYVESYQNGEYKLQDSLSGLKRMYFSGGITFVDWENTSGYSAGSFVPGAVAAGSSIKTGMPSFEIIPFDRDILLKTGNNIGDTLVVAANSAIADSKVPIPKLTEISLNHSVLGSEQGEVQSAGSPVTNYTFVTDSVQAGRYVRFEEILSRINGGRPQEQRGSVEDLMRRDQIHEILQGRLKTTGPEQVLKTIDIFLDPESTFQRYGNDPKLIEDLKALKKEVSAEIENGGFAASLRTAGSPATFGGEAESRRSSADSPIKNIFSKARTKDQEAKLRDSKNVLDKEFGLWSDDAARQKAKETIFELQNKLADVIDSIGFDANVQRYVDPSAEPPDNAEKLVTMFLYSDEKFEDFKQEVGKFTSEKEKTYLRLSDIYAEGLYEPDVLIYLKPSKVGPDWLSDFEALRAKLFSITQWDLLNRFPEAKGLLLWRGVIREEEFRQYASSRQGQAIEIRTRFFSHLPDYAIEDFAEGGREARVTVLADVPLSSIKLTPWLEFSGQIYEPQFIVAGSIEPREVFNLDNEKDYERLRKESNEYNEALLNSPLFDSVLEKFIIRMKNRPNPFSDEPESAESPMSEQLDNFLDKLYELKEQRGSLNRELEAVPLISKAIAETLEMPANLIGELNKPELTKLLVSYSIKHGDILDNIRELLTGVEEELNKGTPLYNKKEQENIRRAFDYLEGITSISSSPLTEISKDSGGIDLSRIELTLKDEAYVSSLNSADIKVLRAAKALNEGWDSLSLLYVHEVMLLFKDKIASDIKNKDILLNVFEKLKVRNLLPPPAVNFMHFIQSQKTSSPKTLALSNQAR